MSKVAIVGAGAVGMTYANTLVAGDLVDEIAIIDLNKEKTQANAWDLLHAVPYLSTSPKKITSADYDTCRDADIVVITANARAATFDEKPDRLKLLEANVKMIQTITMSVMASGFNGIFLVASNPVDVISQVIAECSGLPKKQIIGTGTLLETARLKDMIAENLDVSPKNIHGYVLGEHGNSSFSAWSTMMIGALSLKTWLERHPENALADFDYYDRRVREIGFDIFNGKGNTSYGIASVLARLTMAITRDEKAILPVSTYLSGEYGVFGVYIGAPAVIDAKGVREVLILDLLDEELEHYKKSAAILKSNVESIKKMK
ncbi:L-lactate dehydrogenase [Lactococcus hircilactis]|uniref:L-lactate dehydrogenase n=1 Tax=Lactococcus hircilactis TaxID=1494462 RepID=A0A7X2D080_9LACT|nr:L-lactate dehydrogenase [Lactococcus hircilactis]MQW39128.1 L-lactate dehydrogenase [Lactococcus hircilactis]